MEGPERDNTLRSDSSSNKEPLESKQHVRMTYCVPGPVLAGAQHLILIKECKSKLAQQGQVAEGLVVKKRQLPKSMAFLLSCTRG